MPSSLRPPFAFFNSVQTPACATHIQGDSPLPQSVQSDILKKSISLVIFNPVSLTVKVNHNENTEVASLWPCVPGDTAMNTTQLHYTITGAFASNWLGCVT